MKTMMKRGVIGLAMLLLVSGGAYVGLDLGRDPEPTYVTEPVRRGDIELTVLASGMLQASKLVSVGAQVSGQIEVLAVSLGDPVKQGDLIAQIDSKTQQNNLKEAKASLASIDAQIQAKQAQLKQAGLEFKRQTNMLAADASSRADFESAQASLAVYQADLAQLNAQREQALINVDSAETDLGYTRITAPMDGTVVYTAVEAGQTLNANQSTPTIVELAQLERMTVKAQISEADVTRVKAGQTVYFTTLGQSDKRYYTRLRAIEPGPTSMDGDDSDMTVSDSEAVYYNGLFDVENPEGVLRIGMTTEVSIVQQAAENALLVPAQVLQKALPPQRVRDASVERPPQPPQGKRTRSEAFWQVPVLVNGTLEQRRVKVGINNKVYAEIVEGLSEGDQVVTGMSNGEATFSSSRGRPPMRF